MAKPKAYTPEDALQIANKHWEGYKTSIGNQPPKVSEFQKQLIAAGVKTSSGTAYNAAQITAILDEHGKSGELIKRPRGASKNTSSVSTKAPKSFQTSIDGLISAFLPEKKAEAVKNPEEVEREKLRRDLSDRKVLLAEEQARLQDRLSAITGAINHVDRLSTMNDNRDRSTMTIRELLANPNQKTSEEKGEDAESVAAMRLVRDNEEEAGTAKKKQKHR